MSTRYLILALCAIVLCITPTSARRKMARACSGSADYDITFFNFLTKRRFRNIPAGGLVFSPMSAFTHTPRFSLLTVRGFASSPVEEVCETGNNTNLLALANASDQFTSVVGADGPVPSGGSYTIRVTATCSYSYLTVLSMIAPSPDWVVQLNNVPLVRNGRFIRGRKGFLIAYDCGTDDGGDFTDPSNPDLDRPTTPPLNIAPLVKDDTDRFMGRCVGAYMIRRVWN